MSLERSVRATAAQHLTDDANVVTFTQLDELEMIWFKWDMTSQKPDR